MFIFVIISVLGNDQNKPRNLLLDHTSTILYLCNSDSSKTYCYNQSK